MNRLRNATYVVLGLMLIVTAYTFIRFESPAGSNEKELSLTEQSIKNDAVQQCFKAATITTKEGNTEKVEPIFYIYILCLQDKGYTTNFK